MRKSAVLILGCFSVLFTADLLLMIFAFAVSPAITEKCIRGGKNRNTEKEDKQTRVITADGIEKSMSPKDYLTGVLLAEIPMSFEDEAIKAQAVAARTYMEKRNAEKDKHENGLVCANPECCQAYVSIEDYIYAGGSWEEAERARKAVSETDGELLFFRGELIDAVYFSCSGGKTEDALEVWGRSCDYLRSLDSPGEESSAQFYHRMRFSAEEAEKKLGLSLLRESSDWVGKASHTSGGGIRTMVIADKVLSGIEIRTQLGLPSTRFDAYQEGSELVFEVWGYGHRVGMSQYGAEAMAALGKSYREILAYYYPGTIIRKDCTK